LINPYMNVPAGFGRYRALLEPMPPVGIAYLAASLRHAGADVRVFDAFAAQWSVAEAADAALAASPDVVGISCLTPSAPYVFELARRLKERNPAVTVMLGNLHAIIFADEILSYGTVDIVCMGEGERIVADLVRWRRGEISLTDIRGLRYRNGGVTDTGDAGLIDRLDDLPRPDWRDMPYRRYGLLPFATIAKPLLTVSASRGCPFRCRFCSLKYLGRAVRRRSAESVLDEILALVRDYGVRQIGLVDAYFPIDAKHGFEFAAAAQRIGAARLPQLLAQLRVDVVSRELMRQLRAVRLRRVMFGIEAGAQELLDIAGKRFTLAQARDAVRICREEGVETVGFFIFGMPGDTPEFAERTIRFANKIPLDFAKFSMFVPFPGSDFYDMLIEQKVLDARDWQRFTTFNPKPHELPFVPPGMTPAQLGGYHRRATLRFYLRPRVIANLLFRVRTVPYRMVLAGAWALTRGAAAALLRRPM
jgi:radical SAM superfamily enzyme YgiQ (UPF0313 family)